MRTPALTFRGFIEEDFAKVAYFFDAAVKFSLKIKAARLRPKVMRYFDDDVSKYMYSSKPQLNEFVDYLCKDLTRACSTKPPSVPKVNLANEGILGNGGADGDQNNHGSKMSMQAWS